MARNFHRPLNTNRAIEVFLERCLDIYGTEFRTHSGNTRPLAEIVQNIRDAEAAVLQVQDVPTLTHDDNRDMRYRNRASRDDLRTQILTELWTLDRLTNDEDISLGNGGAQPIGRTAALEKRAYIVTGLPASGKSTMVNKIADQLGAVVVDSDYAKRKLPEFKSDAGAQLVHAESAIITEGEDSGDRQEVPSLLGLCRKQGTNVVMPKIGHSQKSLDELAGAFVKAGYEIHLTMVEVSRTEASMRALHRFCDTKRYVPLGLIFDTYANDPALTYYKYRVQAMNGTTPWKSFGAVSNSSGAYVRTDCTSQENPAALF
ncbi:zeta toxin family protein [Caballeronia cordobensis]|uniref:zeta toxin family protein n=1 Tax=Caballeronia cordobensis TaxID=1353886 RepID=UPI0005EF8D65